MKENNYSLNKAKKIKFTLIILSLVIWAVFTFHYDTTFNNNPVKLWVHQPSTGVSGVPFKCDVTAWDWAGRTSASYKGTVSFTLESYHPETMNPLSNSEVKATLPPDTSFTGSMINIGQIPNTWISGKDYGKKSFEISIDTPGFHYIKVADDEGRSALSNPISITEEEPSKSLVWGDLHNHTILSDGSGLPDYLLTYARDYALLDYAAITDHGEMTLSSRPRPGWIINWVARATEKYNEPNEFVALHGTEWTTSYGAQGVRAYGHYTVVSDANRPLIIARTIQESPEELWNYLYAYVDENDAKALAIPHHLTQTNFEMDWAGANPDFVKAAEVFSVHGEGLLLPEDKHNKLGMVHVTHEPTPGASADCALQMGHRLALIANSDSHDGHPGHSLSHSAAKWPSQWPWQAVGVRAGHPYRGGITGAWVKELNRKEVLEAYHGQRVYGTSAPFRPLVLFEINGTSLADDTNRVFLNDELSPRDINITIVRDGLETTAENWPELRVEIWKNSELWHTDFVYGPADLISLTDNAPVTGVEYKDAVLDEEGNWLAHERAKLPLNAEELNSGGADYYYLRLSGSDNFWSWIGPLWVEVL